MLAQCFLPTIARAAVLASALLTAPGALVAAQAEPISVYLDHAKILRLDRPIGTVVIGNPAIADAAVADSQTVVLTGRDFGTTNIVIFDPEGEPLVDEEIHVSLDSDNTLRVYKQTERKMFSCLPACEAFEIKRTQ